jgi:hypothetical protein
MKMPQEDRVNMMAVFKIWSETGQLLSLQEAREACSAEVLKVLSGKLEPLTNLKSKPVTGMSKHRFNLLFPTVENLSKQVSVFEQNRTPPATVSRPPTNKEEQWIEDPLVIEDDGNVDDKDSSRKAMWQKWQPSRIGSGKGVGRATSKVVKKLYRAKD